MNRKWKEKITCMSEEIKRLQCEIKILKAQKEGKVQSNQIVRLGDDQNMGNHEKISKDVHNNLESRV